MNVSRDRDIAAVKSALDAHDEASLVAEAGDFAGEVDYTCCAEAVIDSSWLAEHDARIRAEGYADAAWDEVAECRMEDRSHGLLCTCFSPLSHPADDIREAYRTSMIANRLSVSSSKGDES